MKIRIFIILTVIFILSILLLYYFLPCFINSFYVGKTGYSNGISESKSNGVFVREYYIQDNQIDLAGYSLPVGEAWLEYPWTRGDCLEKVVIAEHNEYSNYWLYIEILGNEGEDINVKRFMKDFDFKCAIMTKEGVPVSFRIIGDKEYLFFYFRDLPSKNEKLTIIERSDGSESLLIPQKWINPKINGTITLISN